MSSCRIRTLSINPVFSAFFLLYLHRFIPDLTVYDQAVRQEYNFPREVCFAYMYITSPI